MTGMNYQKGLLRTKFDKMSKIRTHQKVVDDLTNNDALVGSYLSLTKTGDAEYIKHITKDLTQFDEIYLAPFADWHIGDPNCDFNGIINYLITAKYIPNAFIVLNGDLINNANNLGKSNSLDDPINPDDELRILNKFISDPAIANKILVVNTGNHENGPRMRDVGMDPIACQLAGTSLFDIYSRYVSRLNIRLKSDYSKTGYVDILTFLDHGNSLSGDEGRVLKGICSLEETFGYSDLMLLGNSHKSIFAKRDKIIDDSLHGGKKTKITTFIFSNPPMISSSPYSQDWRLAPLSTNVRFLKITTKPNLNLLDATEKTRYLYKEYALSVQAVDVFRKDLQNFISKESKRLKNLVRPVQNLEFDESMKEYFNQNIKEKIFEEDGREV